MNTFDYLKIQWLLLTWIFLTSGLAMAQSNTNQELKEEIDRILKTEMRKKNITGVGIALIDHSGFIYKNGYGFSDKANQIQASAQTVYPFGSIAKVITSASVLRLHDMGLLHIDSAFAKYVPEFKIGQHFDEKKPFSIFDLLTQDAGIPRTRLKDLYTDYAGPNDFYDIIQEESGDYLISPPKEVYQYSDIGITMLGVLPIKTAKTDYADFVKKEIFIPMGMSGASFNKDSTDKVLYTKGYDHGKETKIYATRFLPAFGLQASVEDMAKFLYVFMNKGKSMDGKQVLSPAIVERATTRQNQETKIAFSNHLGLVWQIKPFFGYNSVYHGGEQKPVLSMIRMIPGLGLGIVVVSNSNMDGDFLADVVEKSFLAVFKSRGIPYDADYYKNDGAVKVKNPDETYLDSLTGDYATAYGIINVEKKGEKLKMEMTAANKKFSAVMMSDNTFQLRFNLLGFIPIKVMRLFVEDVGGRKIFGRRVSGGRKIFGGEKMVFEYPKTDWDAMSGTYTICNLNDKEYPLLKEIRITEYKGLKVISGEGDIPDVEKFQFCIRPINNNLAIVQGIGGQGLLGETVKRSSNGKSEFIEIAGYLFKKDK